MVRAALFAVLCAILCLFSAPMQALTRLTATIDKNPALQGEAVTLSVAADGRLSADAINFRVLEQDFTVMVPSVSSNTQIINGQSSQSTSWKVVLLPKRTGDITIPAFSAQGLQSEPITLTVLNEQAKPGTAGSGELFLRSEIEQQDLYVQQLTYYKVTIFFNGELQRGSLSEPGIADASVMQVGQDAEGTELVNGIRYRTITRRYAITPQRSGKFTVTPPTFSGEMIDRDSARYNYFARTKTVIQQGQPVDINVSAIPANFPGDWLVAGLVTLNEEWSPDITELKQGEPVTRIITLSAVDVAENQLPELNQPNLQGVRLYQEQPQAKSAERNGRLVAQKVFTTAVIANQAGELVLPEVKLPWWNSKTNKLEHATLAPRKLTVLPDASANKAAAIPTDAALQTAPLTVAMPAGTASSPWQWNYTSTVLLILWLVSTLVSYLIWQHRSVPVSQPGSSIRVKFNSRKLQQACENNNAALAKAELLRYAHQQFDIRCQSLTEVAQLLKDEALQQQLQLLNASLYHPAKPEWRGAALWQVWQRYKPTQVSGKEGLAALYPHQQ